MNIIPGEAAFTVSKCLIVKGRNGSAPLDFGCTDLAIQYTREK